MSKTFTASVIQDEIAVASASGADVDAVEREIQHYAMVYSQDGPVRITRNYSKNEILRLDILQ